jgi:hypothetical protein
MMMPGGLGAVLNSPAGYDPHDDLGEKPRSLGVARADEGGRPFSTENFEPAPDEAPPVGDEGGAYPLIWHGDPHEGPLREWLAEGALPKVGVALISGQWGTFKTFVALDLSVAVITESTFAGRPIRRRGGALVLAAEGQDEIRIRIEALARAKVAPQAEDVDPARLPFAWAEGCPVLTGDQAFAELRAVIANAERAMQERFALPLALIVIDAMTSAAMFQDANDTSEAARVMKMLGVLAREFGLLVVVIDHFGKDVSTGTRNSSAKESDSDAVLALLGERSIEGMVSNPRMALRKVRGAPTGAVTPFKTEIVEVDGANTLIIAWPHPDDLAAVGKTKRPWPKSLRVFKRALDKALDAGKRIRPFLDGPEVLACKRDIVRAEFLKIYSADTPRAKSVAFHRAEQRAAEDDLVCAREIDGESVIWLL